MSDHIDELLARARDGELSFTQRRTLDAHLATCPRCATLARQLERNDVLLATRERPLAPAIPQPRLGKVFPSSRSSRSRRSSCSWFW